MRDRCESRKRTEGANVTHARTDDETNPMADDITHVFPSDWNPRSLGEAWVPHRWPSACGY